MDAVLVWAATTITPDWWLKQHIFISHNSGAGNSQIRVPADSVFGESWLPGSWTAIFLLCPYMIEGVRKLSRGSFIRALVPFVKASSSLPNHLPKALPPRTVTLGVKVTTYKLGNTNIQSITNATLFFCFLSLLSFLLFSSIFSAVQHSFDNFFFWVIMQGSICKQRVEQYDFYVTILDYMFQWCYCTFLYKIIDLF